MSASLRVGPKLLLLFFALCAVTPAAFADVIFGSVPSFSNPQYVSFLSAEGTLVNILGPVYQVTGTAGGSTPFVVTTNNQGSTGINKLFGSGPEVYPNKWSFDDPSINQVTMTTPGNSFQAITFSVYGMLDGSTSALVTVVANDGTFTHLFTGFGPTYNNLFVAAINGEKILSVSVSNTSFSALKNIAINQPAPLPLIPTPEPASLLLVGSGVASLMLLRRRGRTSV